MNIGITQLIGASGWCLEHPCPPGRDPKIQHVVAFGLDFDGKTHVLVVARDKPELVDVAEVPELAKCRLVYHHESDL